MCPCKQRASPSGPDLRAQINGAYWIPDPPCLSTFKRGGGGGGGPESGAHLSNGPDQRARINGDEDHSGPPPPPAFLPLSGGGGGGPESGMQLSDGRDHSARINDARAASPFSVVLCLTSVGPSPLPCHLPFRLSLAAMCHRFSLSHSSTWPFSSPHPFTTRHVSLSLHISFPLNRVPCRPLHTSSLPSRPHSSAPPFLSCAPFSELASMPVL
jgi:hypothetical protein